LLILNDIPAKKPVADHPIKVHEAAGPTLHLLMGLFA
jgi:hypothetical protein